jgi:hypothetical protein
MKRRSRLSRSAAVFTASILGAIGFLASPAGAVDFGDPSGDFNAHIGGWLRNWTGFNLQKTESSGYDSPYNPSMVRNELMIDADAKTGPVKWKVIGRYDKEIETDYLYRLNDLNKAQSPNGLVGRDYMSQYDTTRFLQALREAYADFDVGERVNFRVGKQQIVWGESDFFHAMDLISGFDLRWRLFFENNEEYRKPLFMTHTTVAVPELNGNVDLFVRPGLDPGEAIGNSFNIEGGRWIPTPYQGVDFTSFTAYNYHNPAGDKNDPTYGIRWKGEAYDIGYSLMAMRTFNQDPVINPPSSTAVSGLFGVTHSTPLKQEPGNQVLGDWVYPQTNAFGASANYYVQPVIDSVLSTEVVYIPNKPYNFGQLQSSLPGWGGVINKDTIVSMFRADKNINLQGLLGTNRPSLASLQVFDTWIQDFKASDQIVEFASFGHQKHEHTTYITSFLLANFAGDTINPSLVVGVDASNGGGFLIPAVEFVFGDNWRLKAEADLFWDEAHKSPSAVAANGAHLNPLGINENRTAMFGWFNGDDQLVLRLTRLF